MTDMVLMIDNYDSFTYNLYQQIETIGFETNVVLNDQITIEEIHDLSPDRIVISPGPREPKDSGISNEVIRVFYKSIPIFGVCLGMQCIGEVFGSKIRKAFRPTHGKTREIFHQQKGMFSSLPNPLNVALYHSLAIDSVPKDFELEAEDKDGEIMAIRHHKFPLSGVQFHPESFMTEAGTQLMRNILNE